MTKLVERVMRLKCHVARRIDKGWTNEVLEWYSRERKWVKGRSQRRSLDEIGKVFGGEMDESCVVVGEAFIQQ